MGRPELVTLPRLHIEAGRHPVVEKFLNGGSFVPNDLDLDERRRMLVITGPNMGGKSTYIAPDRAHRNPRPHGQFRAG